MIVSSNVMKTQLLEELERRPDEQLKEVLDFVNSLLRKDQQARKGESGEDLDPEQDPLLQFIDGVSHGALAKDIDDELYGKEG